MEDRLQSQNLTSGKTNVDVKGFLRINEAYSVVELKDFFTFSRKKNQNFFCVCVLFFSQGVLFLTSLLRVGFLNQYSSLTCMLTHRLTVLIKYLFSILDTSMFNYHLLNVNSSGESHKFFKQRLMKTSYIIQIMLKRVILDMFL